jgi:hypothetical protein
MIATPPVTGDGGFEDLVALYGAALESPGDGPARLCASGRAFYDFATKRPGLIG